MTRPPLVKRLSRIRGMDSYSDPTTIPDDYVQYSENMRFLKDIAYTREGITKYATAELSPNTGVQGLGVYNPDTASFRLMAVAGGRLYAGTTTYVFPVGDVNTFALIYASLHTTNLCTILQTQEVVLVVDQSLGMLVYDEGVGTYFAGLPSPQAYNLISSFEATEAWTVTNGTQTPDLGHKVHGKQSINFLSAVGATMTVARTFTAPINMTLFPDGSASTTDDYIRVYFLRGNPATFTSCTLYLGDAAFTAYYSIDLAGLAEWTGETRSYIAFDFKIRKSAFATTGAPNWNNIAAAKIVVVAVAATQASMTLDYFTHFKTGPIAADSGAGTSPNGTYYYKMTFLAANGEESEASLSSNMVVVVNHTISLTALPISGSSRTVRRRLYRIGGSATEWKLVQQFEDNILTTYSDSLADASLGDALVDIAGDPYIPKLVCVQGEYVVLANLTTLDGLYYPDGVMVSAERSYDVYDHLNFFEVEPKSGTEARWLHSEFNLVYVGKEDSVWSFDPTNLDVKPRCETRLYGGVGLNAVCSGENCFYYLDQLAVIRCDGASHTDISTPFVRNFLEAVPQSWLYRSWMRYYDSTLYIGIPQDLTSVDVVSGAGSKVVDASANQVVTSDTISSGTVLVHHVPTGRWYVYFGWETSCAVTTARAAGFGRHLYLGSSYQGFVYDALVGDTDDGAPIATVLQTKDDDFGEPETLKDYMKVFVTGKKLTATDVTLTVIPYQDSAAGAVSVTGTMTVMSSSASTKLELPMPDLGGPGTYLGVRIEGSGRWALRSVVQVARVREAVF